MVDVERTLQDVAHAVTGDLADWCAIDLVDGTAVRRVAVAHVDGGLAPLVREVHERWPPDPHAGGNVHTVLRSGEPLLVRELDDEDMRPLARGLDHLVVLRRLAVRSLLIVPIVDARGVIGAMTLALCAPNTRRFADRDLQTAREIGRRAGAAIHRANDYAHTRAQQRRLRALLDGIDGVVWEARGAPMRFEFVSQKAHALLGFEEAEWLAEGFWASRVHPIDRSWAVGLREERTRAGKDHEMEYRVVAADGRIVWVLDKAFVERDEAGAPTLLRGLMLDITERKQNERRLATQHDVTLALAESPGLDRAAQRVLATIGTELGWEVGALWNVEPDGDTLRCAATWTARSIEAAAFVESTRAGPLSRGEGLPGRVLRNGRAEWIVDVTEDEKFTRRDAAATDGIRAALAFPILGRRGVLGIMEFFSREARPPDEGLLSFTDNLGWQMGSFLERKVAEDEVRLTNARRGATLEASLDCIVSIDATGTITEWNPAAERTFEYTRAEVIGKKLADVIVPPALRESHRAGLARAVATGDFRVIGRRLEIPALRKSGEVFPAELAIVHIPGSSPAEFTGFLRDVSERKRLEEALRGSEERYRSLVEASAQIVWTTPADGLVEDMPTWRAYTGQSAEQVRAHGWLDAVHPQDRERARQAWHDALREGAPLHDEHRVRRADGAFRIMAVRAVPVRNADGTLREWIGTNTDIDDQKRSERALRESEHRYAQILDSVQDMVFCRSPEGLVTYANAATRRYHDMTLDELRVAPRGLGETSDDDAAVARTGQPVETAEEPKARHDGKTRTFHTIKTPIFDTSGNVAEIVAVSRDITERKHAGESLRFQAALLSAQMEAMPVGVLVVSPNGRVVSHNRTFIDMWGFPEAIAQMENDEAVFAMARDRLEDARELDKRLNEARANPDAVGRCELRLKDGRAFEAFAAPVRAPGGTSYGHIWTFADVTEERRTQRRLAGLLLQVEEQRRRLDAIIATVPGVVWETWGAPDAAQQRADFVSEHVQQMLGYTVEEWLSTPNFWLDVVHPDDRERAARESAEIFESKKGGSVEFRWVRKDGRVIDVVSYSVVVADAQGRPQGMRGVSLDVTERRRATEAMRRSDERFQLLARATNDSIWDWDVASSTIWWNENFYDTFGYAPSEVEPGPRSRESRIHPDDAPRVLERLAAALRGDTTAWQDEFRFRHKDGSYLDVLDRALILRDASGAAQRVIGSMLDITARKRAEEAAARLAAIVKTTEDAIYAKSPEGHLVEWNPGAERLFGYTREEILGMPIQTLVPSERVDEERGILARVARGEPVPAFETVRIRKDGTRLDVSLTVSPIRDAHDGIVGASAIARDVTERKRLERLHALRAEELAALAAALERSNRELDQFAYITSHDLKAPLRGIANLATWIEEDLGDSALVDTRKHLDLLRGRVNRMEALIDAILQYSRVGRVRARPETVSVGELVREVVDLLSPPAGFRVDVVDAMPAIVTERARMQQVFLNLIGNAVKHHPNPKEGQIRITCEDAGAHWRFGVADNGRGIPQKYHEKIFVIFQTLEARDKVEGTGIGLALVKKIVQTQGGSIQLESAEGRGATFRFTWPKGPTAEPKGADNA